MTVKAGQKCTAIRRILVPQQHLDAFADRLIHTPAWVKAPPNPTANFPTPGILKVHPGSITNP